MKKNQALQIDNQLLNKITAFKDKPQITSTGKIISLGDGVVYLSGLSQVMMGELIRFPGDTFGLALNLEKDKVGAVILGKFSHLKEGDKAETTGKIINIPVGENFLGRVVDPLGRPLDGQAMPEFKETYPMERIAPGVITRKSVHQPVQTGITAIDSMIPIGRGQRELIIGDRGIGKTSVALTTIINQKGQNLHCIYVAIGQKRSSVAQLVNVLEKFGAMEYTTVVAATASDSASMQYIAPYAATALGEYFAYNGKDALIIYDDLTKHAWAYREISLLLRRPSGREAYPGDVFYLHSRLLERAVKLNKDYGGGSLTALPIIETKAGDVSAYIPTNVISITDGQIYLETGLFNSGFKPAINAGRSVSRVGSAAQLKPMKQVAGTLRLKLAQYRELAAFAQFASDLDEATRQQLDEGTRLSEILKQGWDQPLPVAKQVLLIWAATNGYLNQVPLDNISTWKHRFLDYLDNEESKLLKLIAKKDKLEEADFAKFKQIATNFNEINSDLLNQSDETKA